MRRDHLQLVEFSPADVSLLECVGKLRVAAWATELPSPPAQQSWLDDYDLVARHWAFLCDGLPVASGRMTVHSTLSEVPASEDFVGLFANQLPTPIASLNRVVVEPRYRGLGLGPTLVEVRLRAAEEMGCGSAVASTVSGERWVAQLTSRGFRLAGSTGVPNVSCLLSQMPPAVALVCLLPREQQDAEPGAAADPPRTLLSGTS